MNELMIFNNPEFGTVRTLEESGNVLFCAKDVATVLAYKDTDDAIRRHCPHAVKHRVGVQTGTKADGSPAMQTVEMSFIPESDLYRLVFSSKLPTAEKFTDWVTEEVLPSIRRTGGYIAGAGNMTPEELMAKALTVAQKTLADRCQRHFKMSIFAEMGCRFLQGSIQVLYSLIHHITCRFEARQALIYQLASGLTGENGKYNYSKAVHLYPPFFDIFCSPKNYKTASALTTGRRGCPP